MSESAEPAVRNPIPRGARREAQLLALSLELLAERGYDAFTIDELVTRAGASKATVYRRWESKAELIAEAVRTMVQLNRDVPDTGGVRSDLMELLQRIAGELERLPKAAKSLIVSPPNNDELRNAFDDRFRYPAEKAFVEILERGQARGELLDDVDPVLMHDVAVPLLLVRSVWGQRLTPWVPTLVDQVLCPLILRVPWSDETSVSAAR